MGGDASRMSASGEFVDASGELLYASRMSVSTRRGWSRRMLTGGSRGMVRFSCQAGARASGSSGSRRCRRSGPCCKRADHRPSSWACQQCRHSRGRRDVYQAVVWIKSSRDWLTRPKRNGAEQTSFQTRPGGRGAPGVTGQAESPRGWCCNTRR